MALYLVQHGLANPKTSDPTKGLSEAGQKEVIRIAEVAQGYNVSVSAIVHSGKKRAQQTARVLADHLKPPAGLSQTTGMAPLDDVVAFAAGLDFRNDCMYVGHLPFMSRLTSHLITGDADLPVLLYQNGGIVCLEQPDPASGPLIKWTLNPRIG